MFPKLSDFDLGKYAEVYTTTRDTYLPAAKALQLATGPYKASRDAYAAAAATAGSCTKSLYEQACLERVVVFTQCKTFVCVCQGNPMNCSLDRKLIVR